MPQLSPIICETNVSNKDEERREIGEIREGAKNVLHEHDIHSKGLAVKGACIELRALVISESGASSKQDIDDQEQRKTNSHVGTSNS